MGDETDEGMHKLVEFEGQTAESGGAVWTVWMELGEALALTRLVNRESEMMTGRRFFVVRGEYAPDGSYRVRQWRWADETDSDFRPLPFAEAPE